MKQLLEDIKQLLADKITDLKYIDEDWGQLDYYSPNQPVKYPCAIIDIAQVAWSNQGKHLQLGLANITIRIADLRLSNTNVKAPESQRTKAASIFDLLSSIHAILHGWTPESTKGPLTRSLTRKVNRDDGIREFEMIYSAQIVDDSSKIVTEMYPMTKEKIKLTAQRIDFTAAPEEPDYLGTDQ